MLHDKLINPESIVVIGGSDNISTPGGKVLKNLIDHNFKGKLHAVNPKKEIVQGIKSRKDIHDLPEVDCAIIAIASKYVLQTVKVLTEEKNTKGFIIFSAGFSELDDDGAKMEKLIIEKIDKVGGSLLGPNNIGLINTNYTGVFTTPIPKLDPKGVDLISGSGATAVFIMEASKSIGLTFSSVYTLGNSTQIGVEEMLEHFDNTHDESNSKVKLLYIESIKNPVKFLKHARSLVRKGCKIAAIKAGSSEAGNRAASSHTGALATSDVFVDALFKKAGIIRCYSKNELVLVAGVLLQKELKGKNVALITHAGGPAVMLTDELSKNGFQIPIINANHQKSILENLFNGSSASNPIDFLATGTSEQLEFIIDYCEHKIDDLDGMVVIFGSPGLTKVDKAYDVISKKIDECSKPIYAILPSVVNAKNEIDSFISKNKMAFVDEVLFGKALAKVFYNKLPNVTKPVEVVENETIRSLIDSSSNGYLSPNKTRELLILAGFNFVNQLNASNEAELQELISQMIFPVVMKVVGPLHKSDVGGVQLDIKNEEELQIAFERMMKIQDAESVIVQPMHKGLEIFIGAKRETNFPHIVMCGLGGIYIEAFKDVSTCLVPVSKAEAGNMIASLKSYPILKGTRGQDGINIDEFSMLIRMISNLLQLVPEIVELDINPLLATKNDIVAVDARIRIEK